MTNNQTGQKQQAQQQHINNVQNRFLRVALKKNIRIYDTTGQTMDGRLVGYDSFCILLEADNKPVIYFKANVVCMRQIEKINGV